jgi:hypothetical protein
MKRLIFTLGGAWALALVLGVAGCSFGPDEYTGPFIDEPPPPDDMAEGAAAGSAGAMAHGGAGGVDDAAVGGAGGAESVPVGGAPQAAGAGGA